MSDTGARVRRLVTTRRQAALRAARELEELARTCEETAPPNPARVRDLRPPACSAARCSPNRRLEAIRKPAERAAALRIARDLRGAVR